MDGTYTERWMGSGGFSFLESTTAFLGGSEATYSLPGTKTNNNLVGCLKKVLISSIIEVLERIKYKKRMIFGQKMDFWNSVLLERPIGAHYLLYTAEKKQIPFYEKGSSFTSIKVILILLWSFAFVSIL